MALNALSRLEVVFRFVDQSAIGTASAQGNIAKVQTAAVKASDKMRGSFMSAFPAFTTLAVLGMVGRGIAGILKPSIELTDSLRKMEAVADFGAEGFKKLGGVAVEKLKAIGSVYGFFTQDLVDAFTEVSKKGIPGEAGIKAMLPVVKLARLESMELNDAAEIAVTLFKVWGYEGAELAKRMDQMAFVAQKNRLGFDELMDVITRSATGVAMAKPQFEDFLVVLGATRDISQSAAVAGTQVRRAYEALIVKADKLADVLGVPLKEEGIEGFRNLTDILWEVTAQSRSLTAAQDKMKGALETVGVRAGIPYIALMAQMDKLIKENNGDVAAARIEWNKYKESINGAEGALDKMVNAVMRDNLSFQLDRARVAASQLAQAIGPAFTESIGGFVRGVNDLIMGTSRLIDGLGRVKESLGMLGTVIAFPVKVAFWLTTRMIGLTMALALAKAATTLLAVAMNFTGATIVKRKAAWTAMNKDLITYTWLAKQVTLGNMQISKGFLVAGGAGGFFGRVMVLLNLHVPRLAVSIGLLAKSLKVLWTSLHWIGWITLAIMTILEFTNLFGTKVEDLNKMINENTEGAKTRVDMLRDAGDILGAEILAAATRLKELFAEDTPVLRERTVMQAEAMGERGIQLLTANQQEMLGPKIRTSMTTIQDTFLKLKDMATKKIPMEIMSQPETMAFIKAGYDIKLLKEIAKSTGDARLGKFAEELESSYNALTAQAEANKQLLTEYVKEAGLKSVENKEQKEYQEREEQRAQRLKEIKPALAPFEELTGFGKTVAMLTGMPPSVVKEKMAKGEASHAAEVTLTKKEITRLITATEGMYRRLGGVIKTTIDNIEVGVDGVTNSRTTDTPGYEARE
jgi:TP901 family phage tail tape measure protein